MEDTIVTINYTLELIGDRDLDGFEYLYSTSSENLINHKMSDMFYLKGISFEDIRNYLEGIQS